MTTIPMVTDDATPHVLRAFKMTGPTQMFRELPVNSAQAGATTLRMSTAFPIVQQTGVHYATFEDDGEGMSPNNMPDFINTFGGSGRTIGVDDDNFGIGFKTSAIPDNQRGVVVLSLRDGVTSMMWPWFDPVTNQIGARVLCNPDLLGDEYLDSVSQSGSPMVLVLDDNGDAWEEVVIDGIDWTKVMPQWIKDAGHGTCFVMMGNDGGDTIGKVGGLHQKYGGVKEITRRFWTLPLDIAQTSYPNFENRSTWPGRYEDCDSDRKAEGAQDFLLGAAQDVGTMELTGAMNATVTWVLMPDGGDRRRGDQRGDRISWPATAALYESHPGITELMDLKSGAEARDRIDQFVGPHSVAKRVMVFVEPHGNVWQDGTRTVLRWKEGDSSTPKGLPWADWAREFRANQPEPIAALVREHYAGVSEGADDLTDEDYQRLGSRFSAYLKRWVQVLRPDPDGAQQSGEASESTVGRARRGPRQPRRPSGPNDPQPADQATPGEGHTASTARRVQELPKAQFDPEHFNGRDWAACHYDEVGHIVLINPNHLYVKAVDRALQDKYGDESAERQDLAVQGGRRAIKTHASLVVAHQLQLAQSFPAMHSDMMDDLALTSAFGGVRNMVEVASGYVGDLMRRAS